MFTNQTKVSTSFNTQSKVATSFNNQFKLTNKFLITEDLLAFLTTEDEHLLVVEPAIVGWSNQVKV
jgi:hypothetical protein